MKRLTCITILLGLVVLGWAILLPASEYLTKIHVEFGGERFVCEDGGLVDLQGATPLSFEGATADAFETLLAATDPTADRTVSIPDADGDIALTTSTVVADADGKTITAAEAGFIQINTGAVGAGVWVLPEASTVIGKRFRVAVTVAQNLDINPDDADQILALTNAAGDAIRNATPGNTIELVAVDATNWVAMAPYGTWSDVN